MIGWKKESESNSHTKIILFLLNPILGFLYSLRYINTRTSYSIMFCFFLLFGIAFSVDSVLFSDDVAFYLDGMSHRADFESYKNVSWADFKQMLEATLYGVGERDFYAPIMKFLISRVTNNYHFYFFGIAVVFSFFCMKSLQYLLKDSNFDNSWITYGMVYLFLSIQIFQINGGRFYTAAWIAIYSLFKLYIDKDKRFIFLLFITPFVHKAYLFFIFILLIGFISKRFDKIWSVLFLFSFFFSEIFTELLSNNISILPEFISVWAGYYLDKEVTYGDGGGFYDLFNLIVRIYRNLLIILIIRNSKIVKNNIKTKELYEFLLVLVVFANLTMPISNLGSRFAMLTYPLIAYIWLLNLKNSYKWLIQIMPLVYFYKAFYYDPLMYLKVLEPCFFFSSPIYLVVKYLLI